MTRLLIIGFLMLLPISAQASMFCNRPSTPYCLIGLGSADRFGFDSCRQDMLRFQRAMRDYLECLRVESEDAADELRRAIRQFNDCANNTYC